MILSLPQPLTEAHEGLLLRLDRLPRPEQLHEEGLLLERADGAEERGAGDLLAAHAFWRG